VGPRAGLGEVDKKKSLTLPGLELRPLGRPARSQSLYRLNYPGSSCRMGAVGSVVSQEYRGGGVRWASPRRCRWSDVTVHPSESHAADLGHLNH
jgi:hypothetical protein